MTQPGYVAPASPGWWVRTNRVGTNANEYGFAVSATGARAYQGTAGGAYNWAGTAVGDAPGVLFMGANTSATNTVTIPTHAIGDLIVIFAYQFITNTAPGKPTASGTVPNFTIIDNPAGANTNAATTAQVVASATNHTSGTWSNTGLMIAAVLRGQFSTPIGGHALSGGVGTDSTAPAATLTWTDGSSLILEFHGHRNVTAWSAAPTNYTRQAAITPGGSPPAGVCLNTKDVSTSDGSIAQTSTGASDGYRGAIVEVVYH